MTHKSYISTPAQNTTSSSDSIFEKEYNESDSTIPASWLFLL